MIDEKAEAYPSKVSRDDNRPSDGRGREATHPHSRHTTPEVQSQGSNGREIAREALEQEVESLKRELHEKDQSLKSLARELAEKEAQFIALSGMLGALVSSRLLSPVYKFYRWIRYPYLLKLSHFLRLSPQVRRVASDEQFVLPDEIKTPGSPARHTASCDVVVCVHNALSDVKRCLESVVSLTNDPYSLILVDDGSDDETKAYLNSFARSHGARLIRNEQARGYTFAANQGLHSTQGNYVVLLNSDTVVTDGWLDRMIACAESDRSIGLVGPLSNAATWQSIPEIIANGEFAENKLSGDTTVADMGRLVAQYSARLHPRVPFLNGFCLMIKRDLIEQIGYFDEAAFGRGYGEENDYGLRAQQAGWQLAVAEDAYVYHAQSRSYSHERRKELCEHAGKALSKKHGQDVVQRGSAICRYDRVLEGIRARSRVMTLREELIREGRALWQGKRVLFVLPVAAAGGGANVVFDEAEAMTKMGVEVTVVNLVQHRLGFEESYPENVLPTVYVKKESEIPALFANYDAVIATWCESVSWLNTPADGAPADGVRQPARGYYVQGFEPYCFPEGSENYRMAWESYDQFPDLRRVTKTEWNRRMVRENIGVDCAVVGPSVNIDLYRPRRRRDADWPRRPLRICAMIRPNTPCRASVLTLEILREVYRNHRNAIEIILFGCQDNVLQALEVANDFPYTNVGILSRPQVAALLNEVDVFVDFSVWQTMGLTAMEAMCCGVAVIVPQRGGADTFVTNEQNGIVVDTSSSEACVKALERLVLDAEFRTQLQRRAVADICQFFPERAALNVLNAMLRNT